MGMIRNFVRRPQSASEWIIRMHAGPLSTRDRRALQRWVTVDPRRRDDLDFAAKVWAVSSGLDGSPIARSYLADGAAAGCDPAPRLHAWRIRFPSPAVAHCLSLATLALLCVGILFYGRHRSEFMPYSTTIGHLAKFTLQDGSAITLNADSAIRVRFGKELRQVYLVRGEAFFEVQHDSARKFVVLVGGQEVTVTGTKFDVRYENDNGVEVAVVDGNVNVNRAAADPALAPTRLIAGDVGVFAAGPPEIRNGKAALVSAWRSGTLYFERAVLRDVVKEANLYAALPLVIDDRNLETLSITGTFRAGDTDALLFSLKALYGLEGVRSGGAMHLVRPSSSR
jgi:transmembrane sensor